MQQKKGSETSGDGSTKGFNLKQWKEKHKNAKTQDEITAMIEDLIGPDYEQTDTP